MSSSREQKKAALHEKLQHLRSVTNSTAVKLLFIVFQLVDSLSNIYCNYALYKIQHPIRSL